MNVFHHKRKVFEQQYHNLLGTFAPTYLCIDLLGPATFIVQAMPSQSLTFNRAVLSKCCVRASTFLARLPSCNANSVLVFFVSLLCPDGFSSIDRESSWRANEYSTSSPSQKQWWVVRSVTKSPNNTVGSMMYWGLWHQLCVPTLTCRKIVTVTLLTSSPL